MPRSPVDEDDYARKAHAAAVIDDDSEQYNEKDSRQEMLPDDSMDAYGDSIKHNNYCTNINKFFYFLLLEQLFHQSKVEPSLFRELHFSLK